MEESGRPVLLVRSLPVVEVLPQHHRVRKTVGGVSHKEPLGRVDEVDLLDSLVSQ